MKVNDVRQLIVATLQDLGFRGLEPQGERILTQNRFYIGCRFDFAGVSAIWLEEAGQVRFIDASGKLLKIVRIPTETGNAAIVDRAA